MTNKPDNTKQSEITKAKMRRGSITGRQRIDIPELKMVVFVKPGTDPELIRAKYLENV